MRTLASIVASIRNFRNRFPDIAINLLKCRLCLRFNLHGAGDCAEVVFRTV